MGALPLSLRRDPGELDVLEQPLEDVSARAT